MTTDVKITYVNRSMNQPTPTIFVFTKNMVPTFNDLKDGVAWKTIPNIGRGSSSTFTFPIETTVQAMWGECNKTQTLNSVIGERYSVLEDDTGIVLQQNGHASQKNVIEVNNDTKVPGGIQAQLCKDGKVMLTKHIVAYNQKATFILHPKLYLGVASEIREGQLIDSAVLYSDSFFEQDIEGVTHATVTLTGNAQQGYQFKVENSLS